MEKRALDEKPHPLSSLSISLSFAVICPGILRKNNIYLAFTI
jgi:hypothetical protein